MVLPVRIPWKIQNGELAVIFPRRLIARFRRRCAGNWVCLALFYWFVVHSFLFIALCFDMTCIHLGIREIGFVLHNLVVS